jgi:mannose-6-phosphate isomerase-like protein (cupin superfamily)
VASRRAASGSPEIHDDWVDVTMVQAGRATLLSGGRLTGGSVVGAGEHRGGVIVDGSSRAIAAGDVVIVPAGTPHQFQLTPGDSIRYLTIKVKR